MAAAFAAGVTLAIAIMIALGQPGAGVQPVTGANTSGATASVPLARADDYALRQADAAVVSLNRSDDYALRQADSSTITLSRADDYALRRVDAGAVILTRDDDYQLRHSGD